MHHPTWGFLIVNYLFLGGLSAGLFFVSGVATLFYQQGKEGNARMARLAALLAPWPVAIGCTLLIFDLGKWYRFYKLFLHLRVVSPMSIGTWLLLLFTAISLLYLYSWLTADERALLIAKVPERLAFVRRFDRDLTPHRKKLAAIGVPLSLGVGIYTGVLLGAVQSRPFWNTNLVAQLFLISALSTGCAAVMLVLVLRGEMTREEMRTLFAADVLLMLLECLIVTPYLLHGELSVESVRQSLTLILGGPYTWAFWIGFVVLGLVIPLAVEARELKLSLAVGPAHASRVLTAVTAALVLVGGFMLRYIFVFAGQASSFK